MKKKKTRLEGIQFLKEESTLGVIHIYTAFPKGHSGSMYQIKATMPCNPFIPF